MENQIAKLIQERRLEAAQKNLTSKIRIILETIGEPIISDEAYYLSHDFIPDELGGIHNAHDMDMYNLGWYIDLLNSGENIWLRYDLGIEEIKVDYEGKTVYLEEEGKLTCYCPDHKWETLINNLYEKASKKIEANKYKNQDDNKKIGSQLMRELARLWGFMG